MARGIIAVEGLERERGRERVREGREEWWSGARERFEGTERRSYAESTFVVRPSSPMVGSLEGQCQHNWREWVHETERQAERERDHRID